MLICAGKWSGLSTHYWPDGSVYFLARLEETGLSIWLRESDWSFFGALTVHSISLALTVGICIALNLNYWGVLKNVHPASMDRFLPLMWCALFMVVLSGLLLLLAYPAKALTNIVFYVKLGAIAFAFWLTFYNRKYLIKPGPDINKQHLKLLAVLAIGLWITSVTAGRFLAYTHSVLLASRFY